MEHLEGSGDSERAHTLATDAFREGQEGAISAVAVAPRGATLRTPDMYMSKLIVGPGAKRTIDIDAPVAENIEVIARALGRRPSELTVGYFRGGTWTHTVVMSTEPRVVRFMDTIHALEPEAGRRGFQL